MDIKPITGAALGIGATSLAIYSTKALPKVKKTKKKTTIKAPSTKDLFNVGVGVMVGGALLSGAAKAMK